MQNLSTRQIQLEASSGSRPKARHDQKKEKKSILLIKFHSKNREKEERSILKRKKENVYGARRKLIKVIKRPSGAGRKCSKKKKISKAKKCFHL